VFSEGRALLAKRSKKSIWGCTPILRKVTCRGVGRCQGSISSEGKTWRTMLDEATVAELEANDSRKVNVADGRSQTMEGEP
jgi:hypothetical protein